MLIQYSLSIGQPGYCPEWSLLDFLTCCFLWLMPLKEFEFALNLIKDLFFFSVTCNSLSLLVCWRHEFLLSWFPIRIVHFYFHFFITCRAFFLIFNHMINLLLTELALDHIGKMLTFCHFVWTPPRLVHTVKTLRQKLLCNEKIFMK